MAGVLDQPTKDAFWARKAELDRAAKPDGPVVDGEAEPDRDATWSQVLSLAAARGWNTAETSRQMREQVGKDPTEADGWTFSAFLTWLKAEPVPA